MISIPQNITDIDYHALNEKAKEFGTPDIQDSIGFTLLHYAAYYGQLDVVNALEIRGANIKIDNQSCSPLMYAIENNHEAVANYFIDTWALDNILIKNYEERTILHLVTQNDAIEILEKLFAKTALKKEMTKHLNEKDLYGQTPIDLAVRYESDSCLRFIYDNPDLNVESLPNYAKPLQNLEQDVLEEQFKKYLTLAGIKTNSIITNNGSCNGWEFLYNIYFSLYQSDEYYYDLIRVVATWDGTKDDLLSEDIPLSLKKEKYVKKKDVFEQLINDLAIFQLNPQVLEELQLGTNQESRVRLYDLINDKTRKRICKEVFAFHDDIYAISELMEIFNFFSHWPELYIDVKSTDHSMSLIITKTRKFKFYNSNYKDKVSEFNNVEDLVNHIAKFHYKTNNHDPKKGLNLFLNGYKFYDSNKQIPMKETPLIKVIAPLFSSNGWNSFHYAVMNNDLKALKKTLKTPFCADIEEQDNHGVMPMRMAIRMRNEEIINLLLDHMDFLEDMDNVPRNSTSMARHCSFFELLRMSPTYIMHLLKIGRIKINDKDVDGNTMLNTAVKMQDFDLVDLLLSVQDVDVNIPDMLGWPPLMYAFVQDYQNDVDISQDKKPPFLKHKGILKKLLSIRHININIADTRGMTPLMIAIMNHLGDDLISIILNKKMQINMKDSSGRNALMYAVLYKANLKVVIELLNKGANPQYKDNEGVNCLMLALNNNSDEAIIHTLLDTNELNINSVDSQSRTALMYAIEANASKKMIVALLHKNAALDLVDNQGRTVFDYAKTKPKILNLIENEVLRRKLFEKKSAFAIPFFKPQQNKYLGKEYLRKKVGIRKW